MKALVIVDVQNDFIPGGSLEVPYGASIVPVINSLLEKFDLVVATQDWHPQNHKSFASVHENKNPFDKIILHGMEQILWPDHCVQGTQGADFHPDLETKKIAAIFRKGMDTETDSYSGFYDNGHKNSTGLSGYLKEKGATEIYFCGLAGEICVFHTIKDSIDQGFSTYLIEDATMPLNKDVFESIKNVLTAIGVGITSSSQINPATQI